MILRQLCKSRSCVIFYLSFTSSTELLARPDIINRMNYANFATEITAKFGIICEGWPLDKFCPPSAITSRTQLDILCRAWETGVTSFRKLTPEEYEEWSNSRFQAALQQSQTREPQDRTATIQTNTSVIAHDALTITSETAIVAAPPSATMPETISLHGPAPSASNPAPSVSVMSVSGTVLVAKKTRKQRSDKGKPRGPRAQKNLAPQTTA